MKLLDKLYQKRAAAKAEYEKWNTIIQTLETDDDLGAIFANNAALKLREALKLNGHANGNGNGHAPGVDNVSPRMRELLAVPPSNLGNMKRYGKVSTKELKALRALKDQIKREAVADVAPQASRDYSDKARKAASRRMKKLWRDRREDMMKSARNNIRRAKAAQMAARA